MVDAFKNGELDYIRNPTGAQFNQLKTDPSLVAINSAGNGFTQINFNTYDKDIPDGGASTKALHDPAFRAALGYAIDRQTLIDKVLSGYGVVGTTQVPAWQRHGTSSRPTSASSTSTVAGQKLDEAGYPLEDGKRIDKEGKPINLSLQFPNSDASLSQGRPVHPGLVRPDRHRGDQPRGRLGHARDDRVPRFEHPAQGPAQVRHGHLGLGR